MEFTVTRLVADPYGPTACLLIGPEGEELGLAESHPMNRILSGASAVSLIGPALPGGNTLLRDFDLMFADEWEGREAVDLASGRAGEPLTIEVPDEVFSAYQIRGPILRSDWDAEIVLNGILAEYDLPPVA